MHPSASFTVLVSKRAAAEKLPWDLPGARFFLWGIHSSLITELGGRAAGASFPVYPHCLCLRKPHGFRNGVGPGWLSLFLCPSLTGLELLRQRAGEMV